MPPTGLTKDAGWQIGVRKTFAVNPQNAWILITSEAGLRAWLGDLHGFIPEKGAAYQLADGTHGKITVYQPGSHLRLTWMPPDFPRPSIIQVRVIENSNRTTIAFHQEHLPDGKAREERKTFFDQAMEELSSLITKR